MIFAVLELWPSSRSYSWL